MWKSSEIGNPWDSALGFKASRRSSKPENFGELSRGSEEAVSLYGFSPYFSLSISRRMSTYSRKSPAIKDTNAVRRARDSRRSHPSRVAAGDAESEKFPDKSVGWSCESAYACARDNRSADPSGIPERGLEEVILYRGEHVVARGATASSTAKTTPTTAARRRDDAGRRLQSSSCFGPLNSSWEMKPFLSLSSCWKISSTSLSWSASIFFTSSFSPAPACSASITCFRK